MNDRALLHLPGRIFLLFLVVSAVVCLPALVAPSSRIIGNIDHPGLQGELFHQSDLLANARDGDLRHAFTSHHVGAPDGMDLREFVGFSLHLFFYLPLIGIGDLILRHNLLVWLVLALNGYCAYLLGWQVTRQRLPSLVCGLLFLLSPYALLKLDMGFIQKIILWWIPLFLRDLLRFLDTRKPRHAFLAGLAWSLMLLTYAPYAWYATWAGGLWVGFSILNRPSGARNLFVRGWPALIPSTAAVLFLVLSLPYQGGAPHSDGATPLPLAVECAPVGSFDITAPFRFHPYPGFMPVTDSLTLGLSLVGVLLALVAILRRKRNALHWLAVALFFLVIAIGPYPNAHGHMLSRIPLPYYLFACHLPWGMRLGFPIRALPFTEIALAALAALALTRSARPSSQCADPAHSQPGRGAHLLGFIIVVTLIVLERALFLPELFPPRATSAVRSDDLEWIKRQGGTVLHLPVNIKGNNVRRYLYITARTGTRMMNRYLNLHEGFPVPPLPNPSPREMQDYLAALRQAGCDLILVHPRLIDAAIHPLLMPPPGPPIEPYTSGDTAAFRDGCGPPVYSNGTRLIAYRVPDRPLAPVSAAHSGRALHETPPVASSIPESELRSYFEAHRDVFQRERQIRVHHFFVPTEPDPTAVQQIMAAEEAKRIEAKVARSNADSFELAERLTREDPLGRRWGDMGYIARGCLPEDVEAPLFRMEELGTTLLLERPDGFHIFRLMDIRPGHQYTFEEVRTAIRDAILRERHETAGRPIAPAPSSADECSVPASPSDAYSSPDMIFIPGGVFWMGSTEDDVDHAYRMAQRFAGRVTTVRREWFEDEAYRRVRVRPFFMDRREVTVADYRAFEDATGRPPLPDWAHNIAQDENMPVVGVSLDDAQAYAQWVGKRLPTVEEWAWAARGPQRRRYPWGDEDPDGARCNYANASTSFAWRDTEHDDGAPGLAAVGSYPNGATPEGLLDMAGNVREWTATGRQGIVDQRDGHIWTLPQQHLIPSEYRSDAQIMYCVRGGGWNNAADDMRCSDERMLPPDTRNEALGFRCVRDAPAVPAAQR